MPAFLVPLLMNILRFGAGVGGSAAARAGLGRLLPNVGGKLATRLLGPLAEGAEASLGRRAVAGTPGYIGDILGFAGGETLAEQIPGVPSHGGFLDKLGSLALGFGGGRAALGLLGPAIGRLPAPLQSTAGFGAEVGGGLGAFLGLEALLGEPEGGVLVSDNNAQLTQLLANIDSGRLNDNPEQFQELVEEVAFQADSGTADPVLLDELATMVGGLA